MAASLDKRGVIWYSIDVEGKENKKEGQVVNMSYCRFENTYLDLQECAEALDASDGVEGVEKSANEYEKRYVRKLVELCQQIAEDFGDNDDGDDDGDDN